MKNLIVSASQPEGSKKKNDLFRMISFLVIMAGSIKTIFSGFPSIAQEWWIYTVCCAGSSLFLFPIFKTKKKDWMFLGRNCLWGLGTWKTKKRPGVVVRPSQDQKNK